MTSAERIGRNIKRLRVDRNMTQVELGERIGSDGPRVGRLEKGAENPTVETLDKLAVALSVDVAALLEPRPEDESGHAEQRAAVSGHPGLERLLVAIDEEFPAEDTVEGDIHKAIAALNRALRRGRSAAAPAGQAAKTGR